MSDCGVNRMKNFAKFIQIALSLILFFNCIPAIAADMQIAAGADFTVGLNEDGTVIAIGSNDDGELNVTSWTEIQQISAGGDYTVGLKEDGTVASQLHRIVTTSLKFLYGRT